MRTNLPLSKTKCSGCGACRAICPKGAIRLSEDDSGFLYPEIDPSRCIDCGLCLKTCPFNQDSKPNEQPLPQVLAAQATDPDILAQSSSGGITSLLIEEFLSSGGIAFGAVFSETFQVHHQKAETPEEARRFWKSKYVQSNTRSTFQEVKTALNEGRRVLYVGTPCQIAGLLRVVGKNHPNLLTIDFLCHGVPSQRLFDSYLKDLQKKLGSISAFHFRVKGGDYFKPCLKIEFPNHVLQESFESNSYMQLFLKNYSIRPSCTHCLFRCFPRCSDITVADYWGGKKTYFQNASSGVSYVFLNTHKGVTAYQMLHTVQAIDLQPDNKTVSFFVRPLRLPFDRNLFLSLVKKVDYSTLAQRFPSRLFRLQERATAFCHRCKGWFISKWKKL